MNGVSKLYVCSRKKEACQAIEKQVNSFLDKNIVATSIKERRPKFVALEADLSTLEGIESFCMCGVRTRGRMLFTK